MQSLKNLSPKKKQYLLAGLGASVSAIVLAMFFSQVFKEDTIQKKDTEFIKETNIQSAGRELSPQEVWVERIQSENKLLSKKLDQVETLLEKMMQEREEEKLFLEQKLEEARSSQEAINQEQGIYQEQTGLQDPFSNASFVQNPIEPLTSGQETKGGIKKVSINLAPPKDTRKEKIKTIENRIPAGTYATAVLLSGVDASTSINAQGDPRPVLMKLIDHGTLPRRFYSDLQGCHVIGSSYGDLSSERAYIRLEKITCTERQTGEIIETKVAGYVSGEDGKVGIRGVIVDKSTDMIQNSFFGGFLGGVADFFKTQETRAVFPVSPFGQTNALSSDQMLKAGAGSGASNALNKMADFYIKRAEQLQPVVQVAAGRRVNIVIVEGADFGDTRVRETLEKAREAKREEEISKLGMEEQKTNWLPHAEGPSL